MKTTFLLTILAAAGSTLARTRTIYLEDLRAGNFTQTPDEEPIHSRDFQRRTLQPGPDNWKLSTWNTGTKWLDFDVEQGHIFSSPNAQNDIHSIVEIPVPIAAAGRRCQVYLSVDPFGTVNPLGAQFDVWTLRQPAPAVDGPYEAAIMRDEFLGVAQATMAGDSIPPVGFECMNYAGDYVTLELTPHKGPFGLASVNVEWDDNIAGPYLMIL